MTTALSNTSSDNSLAVSLPEERPSPVIWEETVLVIGIGIVLENQKLLSLVRYVGVELKLSHLPEGEGSLGPRFDLGGKLGEGKYGLYLGSRGGGGRKFGLATMTGVCGLDGGDDGGVACTSPPTLGDV